MHHNIKHKVNKNKSVLETILLHNLDFAILMETWLKDMDEDQAWVKTSNLTNKEFRMDTINRPGKQGVGIAILTNEYTNHNAKNLTTSTRIITR